MSVFGLADYALFLRVLNINRPTITIAITMTIAAMAMEVIRSDVVARPAGKDVTVDAVDVGVGPTIILLLLTNSRMSHLPQTKQ